MTVPGYRYLVETYGPKATQYDGRDAADAMAAWSRQISAGAEYVTLEALQDARLCEDERVCRNHCGSGPCSRKCPTCLRLAFTPTKLCPACPDRRLEGTL